MINRNDRPTDSQTKLDFLARHQHLDQVSLLELAANMYGADSIKPADGSKQYTRYCILETVGGESFVTRTSGLTPVIFESLEAAQAYARAHPDDPITYTVVGLPVEV